jgi:glycosyltransferase 2 family protein
MRGAWRKWWPVVKAVLAVAILLAVGRQFARDLGRLDLGQRALRFNWLVLAGVLYVAGIGLSALYWHRLLRGLGQRPSGWAVVRAYYIGHLGKYLPGKAWALLMRTALAAGSGVRVGVAVLSSFYEVLATMAAGSLLGAVIFAAVTPDWQAPFDWRALPRLFEAPPGEQAEIDPRLGVLLGVLLLGVTGLPLVPAVFNRLVHRLTRRFRDVDAEPLPRARHLHLAEGLLLPAAGWLVLGASLWAVLQAVRDQPQPWDWAAWLRYSASLSLAYVAGFAIVVVPGGLGVREFLLTLFLARELDAEAAGLTVLAVLVLRLVWTVAEVLVAGVVWWLPGPAPASVGDVS